MCDRGGTLDGPIDDNPEPGHEIKRRRRRGKTITIKKIVKMIKDDLPIKIRKIKQDGDHMKKNEKINIYDVVNFNFKKMRSSSMIKTRDRLQRTLTFRIHYVAVFYLGDIEGIVCTKEGPVNGEQGQWMPILSLFQQTHEEKKAGLTGSYKNYDPG